ncbi:LytR/AlgR family response regulator transcription factor [Poritiphilus flavus]|uniref:Response regulator n=1 Tax=Poritiphilus flavus TaxID=2697053 RepID=A0A6L9EGN2_9FLAO|nr:LytTR family DNA-binding domain-containing protein [Poritiphilus flavus]NAS13851.1 response regulator [Poritiphilus flavus]
MRILILEDEIPAKKKLVKYLVDYFGESVILESSRTVKAGIELLEENPDYDLILSDIKLLDGNAFEVFSQVDTKAPIIFCTAYDEHLLQAFQTNGIAYILKPYQEDELKQSLRKFERLFQSKTPEKGIFKQLQEALKDKGGSYKKRLAIKKRDGIKLLEVSQISLIQANGDFCKLFDSNGGLHSISRSIGVLNNELDPKHFFKINRSQIVGIAHIEKIEPYSKNRLAIRLKAHKEHLVTSSSVTKDFRIWLEN